MSKPITQSATTEKGARRVRKGGRNSHKNTDNGRGGFGIINQIPWQEVLNPLAPIEFLQTEGVDKIHEASLSILKDIGIEVLYDPAREIYEKAGCKIDRLNVRFDTDMVLEMVAKAPSEFKLKARNPKHDLTIGGRNIAFCLMGSAPNCSDLDNGRRPGNREDFVKFIKLGQSLNIIHMFGGYPVEPIDIPPDIRHLDGLRDVVTHTDKVFSGYSLGPQRARDSIEIARLANGVSHEEFERHPRIVTIINTNSPLRLDNPMANGILEYAKRNQAVCITPFTLAGAMAPVTLAAALAEQNAEALAAIALTQLVREGSPVIYGAFTSNVDMRSGAPAFGTPEYTKAALISGQLARRYNLPFRTSNTSASNAVDGQAAYESMMSLWGAVMGGGNFIKHAAGWMEGGLVCSYEKIILDAELLQSMTEFLKPIGLEQDDFGVNAIKEVGAGGHFFGSPHTMERYENAFYAPMLSDWRNFQTWKEAGGENATLRANKIWKQLLEDYEPPPFEEDRKLALNDYIDRRIKEGGAPGM